MMTSVAKRGDYVRFSSTGKVGRVCSNTEIGVLVQAEMEQSTLIFPAEVADKISEKLMDGLPEDVKEQFKNNELQVTFVLKPYTSIIGGEGTKESPFEIK